MSFKKFTTSAVVAASLLAANLSPLAATAANAGNDWRKHNDNRGYSSSYDRFRKDKPKRFSDYRRYDDRYDRYDRRHHHRDHNGRNVAKGVAIGLGILAVGAILASESHR
jgi:hypothetical protein